MKSDFFAWMDINRRNIEDTLDKFLPASNSPPEQLNAAIRYAVLGHGKRIRPLLVIAASEIGNANLNAVQQRIAAVEFIHTYSLVHDDLPAMDNDSLRHGKPTCHKVFGEGMAILAGDTLQTLAFECLAQSNELPTEQNLTSLSLLAHASGFNGMAGGQALDLVNTGQKINIEALINMHRKKTGGLITASVLLGYLACKDYLSETYQELNEFAEKIGLAFQIVDDILDTQSSTDILGKTAGKDLARDKATFVSLLGIETAKQQASELINSAIIIAQKYQPNSQHLIDIAHYVLHRDF